MRVNENVHFCSKANLDSLYSIPDTQYLSKHLDTIIMFLNVKQLDRNTGTYTAEYTCTLPHAIFDRDFLDIV